MTPKSYCFGQSVVNIAREYGRQLSLQMHSCAQLSPVQAPELLTLMPPRGEAPWIPTVFRIARERDALLNLHGDFFGLNCALIRACESLNRDAPLARSRREIPLSLSISRPCAQ